MKAPHGIQGCLRFSRHGGIYRSDGRFKTLPEFPRGSASRWSVTRVSLADLVN